MKKIKKADQEWRKQLTEAQYHVTREKGTEPPFSGVYYQFEQAGIYHCVCCDAALFSSVDKFTSPCGWPSFRKPLASALLEEHPDYTLPGEPRIEVTCAQCDAHLGHVFTDGPPPSGQRYCINSVVLEFKTETK